MKIRGREIVYSTKDNYSLSWFLPRYLSGIHEPKTTDLLTRLSKGEGDILDVGANIGWFTCIAGIISEDTVHSFELDEENFQRLRVNVSLNNLKGVKINRVSVTNSTGRVSYWKEPGSASPMFSLNDDQKKDRESVEVDAVTLDDYVKDNCQSVGVVKIDVEGGERAVLEGGLETINEFRPHILLEVHPHPTFENSEVSVKEVLLLLPDHYNIYHVSNFRSDGTEMGSRISVSEFDSDGNTMLYAEPSDKPLRDYPTPEDCLYEFT